MTTSRDFLAFNPPTGYDQGPSASELAALAQVMDSQYQVLLDIRRELCKQNPDVLADSVISNAGINQTTLTDTLQHEVFFNVGGRSAVVHKLRIWSTYAQPVYFSWQRMAVPQDGIPFTNGSVLLEAISIRTAYIWCPTLSGGALNINGSGTIADGTFNLYGWTIPQSY